VTIWIAMIFTLGVSIFYALSMIERKVWPLMLKPKSAKVAEAEIRFVHKVLKHLTSVLPLSNGLVILGGTTLLVIQSAQRNWDLVSLGALVLYWSILLFIVVVRRNPEVVIFLRSHDSERDPIDLIRSDVARVQIDHHLGLLANIAVLTDQLSFLTTY